MPVYISLINLTDQGIRTIKDDPGRVRAATQLAQHEGVRDPWRMVDHGSIRCRDDR